MGAGLNREPPQALAVGVSGGLQKVNTEGLFIAAGQNLKRLLSAKGWGGVHCRGERPDSPIWARKPASRQSETQFPDGFTNKHRRESPWVVAPSCATHAPRV